MTESRRHFGSVLLLGACALSLSGCLSESPSYFPYLIPPGDIQQTHAKPPGNGPYVNFDPYACRIEARPQETSHPVGANHVVIATIYDASGHARRGRRVEWMIEGAGHIIEVDESGCGEGRGYKVDSHYAVSYTAYRDHLATRGNDNPTDDFTIRPGQTWCVVSSAVEGDTHITCYAPEVYNWDRNKVTVTTHWINAGWTIPQPAANRMGAPHTLTTNVYRVTDKMPLGNYRVRYTVLDGPPAVFLPGQQRVAEVITDLQGNGVATLAQVQPQAGVNRIGVEIVRPQDPCSAMGPGIIIGRGETTKEWLGASLAINKTGPSLVSVGQVFTYTITISNTGRVQTEDLTLRDAVPEGVTFMSAQPAAQRDGNDLIWTLGGALGPGQSTTVQVTYRADRPGTITNAASVVSPDGQRAETRATTQVTNPGLNAAATGPATGNVNSPINVQIALTNTGTGPATTVRVRADLDPGLEHQSGERAIESDIGTVNAGETRTIALTLTPRQQGVLGARVTASADGGLVANADYRITVSQPRLDVRQTGPTIAYLGGTGSSDPVWNVTVTNSGDTPLSNVIVRYQLAPEFQYVRADQSAQFLGNGQVVWNLGTLAARDGRQLQVVAHPQRIAERAVNVASATADPSQSQQDQAVVEILGVPAFRLEALNQNDGIIEVGKTTSYVISVTNQGTLVANGLVVTATLPPQLRFRSGIGPQNSQGRLEGNKVVFAPVDGLPPGQNVRYQIDADAVNPGQVIFAVEMAGSILSKPVRKEVLTNILGQPGSAPAPAAPPPASPPAMSPPVQ